MTVLQMVRTQSEVADALVEMDNLQVHFPVRKGAILERQIGEIKAVDGVSFSIRRGETFGLVGESGCGKTTVARTLLKLENPTGGRILFDGADISEFDRAGDLAFRRRVQAVFQDPFSSLNPRMTAGEIIGEPFVIHTGDSAAERLRQVRELLELCGLPSGFVDRYPHEMSGGQRQRIGIARALALRPELIVCDEAVSALDVSIQAQIINLLEQLRDELGLTYLFIGHDLSVVRHICDTVGVMYLGKLVETAESEELFANPRHPYTQALIDAVPVPDPEMERARPHRPLRGEVPSPMNPPTGCVFHTRCPLAHDACQLDVPAPTEVAPQHTVSCIEVESAEAS